MSFKNKPGVKPKTIWSEAMKAQTEQWWIEGESVRSILTKLKETFPAETSLLEYGTLRSKMRMMGIFARLPPAARVIHKPCPVRTPEQVKEEAERLERNRIKTAVAREARLANIAMKKAEAAAANKAKAEKIRKQRAGKVEDWDYMALMSPLVRRRAQAVMDYKKAGGRKLLTTSEIDAMIADQDRKAA